MSTRRKLWTAIALAVACSAVFGGAVAMRTRWLNEETAAQAKWQWEEHCRQYGALSNLVIYLWQFDTNFTVPIGVGTNREAIEFGFREDGVVVWRKR